MMKFLVLVLIIGASFAEDVSNKKFPSDFLFGVATAAFQIEGAWNEDGKSPSIWDAAIHANSSIIANSDNADITCDSYHKFKEDIAILKELGVSHYRFSLAWTRILPDGIGKINDAGVAYYKNLIKELKANNIEPFVTLYHWDLPDTLQQPGKGGFLNISVVQWFEEYARVCFSLFGDDVKYWATFNEPIAVCNGGYASGLVPPLIRSEGIKEYVCVYHLLLAHARAWHVYDEEFRQKQRGKISIVLNTHSFLPATNSEADIVAAETKFQFMLGLYANPIFVGDFPDIVKKRIAARSTAEGRKASRLPSFSKEEAEYIKGTHDYFGLNVYSAYLVNSIPDPPVTDPPTNWGDAGVNIFQPADWESTSSDHTKVVPWTIRPLLNWLKDHYNNPGIFITENGYPSHDGSQDDRRIYYIKGYLSHIRDTMEQDNVTVLGYTVWTLMDNFEWTAGYTQKFGLYEVNFNDPNRTRTARPSVDFYKKTIKTRCLVDQCID
ncbi:myrosinase 1-like [Diabrotica undecimpunctata]|uniref:myrosinase 1-like n=1 Tax=Diabrotica undecimpunctata TaxID=50387 RepID=UPI003B63E691